MLEFYFDESESSIADHPAVVIAGYGADDSNWRNFNQHWRQRVLSPFKIPYFHAKELRSQNARLYRHLGFAERRSLLQMVISVISDNVKTGASVYMRPHDWESITTHTMRTRWGSAYGMCMELLLAALSQGPFSGTNRQRVNVFLEEGHVNAQDALQKVRNYKYDTESIEWPTLVGEAKVVDEDPLRMTAMQIGGSGLVAKRMTPPVQAADLLAFLMGSAIRSSQHPVFSGVLDELLSRVPVLSSGWGPSSVQRSVEGIKQLEGYRRVMRTEMWQLKKQLREQGMTVYELPWGIVMDRAPSGDEESQQLKEQVNAILEKLT